MEYIQLTNRITISKELFFSEYDYMFGKMKNELVKFYYDHKVRGMGRPINKNYSKAIALATKRAGDGRYKNYNFYITNK